MLKRSTTRFSVCLETLKKRTHTNNKLQLHVRMEITQSIVRSRTLQMRYSDTCWGKSSLIGRRLVGIRGMKPLLSPPFRPLPASSWTQLAPKKEVQIQQRLSVSDVRRGRVSPWRHDARQNIMQMLKKSNNCCFFYDTQSVSRS